MNQLTSKLIEAASGYTTLKVPGKLISGLIHPVSRSEHVRSGEDPFLGAWAVGSTPRPDTVVIGHEGVGPATLIFPSDRESAVREFLRHAKNNRPEVNMDTLAQTAEDLWTRLGPFSTREVLEGGTSNPAYSGNTRKITAELERLGFTRRDIPASYGAVAVWFKR